MLNFLVLNLLVCIVIGGLSEVIRALGIQESSIKLSESHTG